MINDETKRQFLKELASNGNVYIAARKTGIHRDSHYRWKREDPTYRKAAAKAEKIGRENNCDIAEHALMINVKDKKMDAIKYLLSHNSKRYRPKRTSNVVIEHRSTASGPIPLPERTFEDLIREQAEKNRKKAEG